MDEPTPRPPSECLSRDDERPTKRSRVSLACQRCKTRKQKCNGETPACSNCVRFKVDCHYIFPAGWKPGGRKFYIAALENRIAELEGYLSGIGHPGVNDDHLNGAQQIQHVQQAYQVQPPQELTMKEEEVDYLSTAIREISLGVNGHYIGNSSSVTLGRLLDSLIKSQNPSAAPSRRDSGASDMPMDDSVVGSPSSTVLAQTMGPMFVSDRTSKRLFDGYLTYVATRFPVLHTPRIKELQANREHIDNPYDAAILHLVYACSGRFLEFAGVSDVKFYPDQHYEAAVVHMNEILGFGDTRSVVYLVLLAVYSTRAAKDVGAWTYIGLAMRLCVDIGIHRQKRNTKPSLKDELESRIFWVCYFLDREISVVMGRPPALSDNDIDANLPLDIDESVDDDETIIKASKNVTAKPRSPPTSLTGFVHQLRLKRIESEIQRLVYRVDKPFNASEPVIQELHDRLVAWEAACPAETRGPMQTSQTIPIDTIDVYYIHYYRALRLLLYPTLTWSPVNYHYVTLCAQASGGICEYYKRLHHSTNVSLAPLSLQTIFLAGLTLVYCMSIMPELAVDPRHIDQLSNCSIMLYVLTVRYPSARKYRDVFEDIKASIRKFINKPKNTSKRTASFDDGMRENFRTLETGFGAGGAREEFNWMIGELTGGAMTLKSEDQELSPKSRAHGPAPGPSMVADLMFTADEERGNQEESSFAAAMYDYDNLGADWADTIVVTEGIDPHGVDFGEWGQGSGTAHSNERK